jgi:hypothetical protein
VNRHATPAFVASGEWRSYVGQGESVLVVPLPTFFQPAGMTWSTDSGLDLPISHGYFLGPDRDRHARYGPVFRPTDWILTSVRDTGRMPELTDADRDRAREDLKYWHTAIIILRPAADVPEALIQTVNALVGQGQYVGGVWLWDVRTLTR